MVSKSKSPSQSPTGVGSFERTRSFTSIHHHPSRPFAFPPRYTPILPTKTTQMASGASAADVRSILSIAGAGPSTSSTTNTNGVSTTTQVQPTASSSKLPQVLSATSSLQNVIPLTGGATPSRKTKPEGISRELYALIGTGIPSLSAKPKFKQKPKLSDGRVGRWYVIISPCDF